MRFQLRAMGSVIVAVCYFKTKISKNCAISPMIFNSIFSQLNTCSGARYSLVCLQPQKFLQTTSVRQGLFCVLLIYAPVANNADKVQIFTPGLFVGYNVI